MFLALLPEEAAFLEEEWSAELDSITYHAAGRAETELDLYAALLRRLRKVTEGA